MLILADIYLSINMNFHVLPSFNGTQIEAYAMQCTLHLSNFGTSLFVSCFSLLTILNILKPYTSDQLCLFLKLTEWHKLLYQIV